MSFNLRAFKETDTIVGAFHGGYYVRILLRRNCKEAHFIGTSDSPR